MNAEYKSYEKVKCDRNVNLKKSVEYFIDRENKKNQSDAE